MSDSMTASREVAGALGPRVRLTPYSAGNGLPVFVEPTDSVIAEDTQAACAWLREHQEVIDAYLTDVGAIVLRGFAFPDTAAFNAAVEHYPDMPHGYVGGATPRANISGRAFEATRAPGDAKLMFHQEMAYLPSYPRQLAFFCNRAPPSGGATLIADVRKFDDAVPRRFRDEVHRRGVRYTRNFRDPEWSTGDPAQDVYHRPWTEAFCTERSEEAEAACRAMGLDYRWEANGSFSVIYVSPGFVTHPRTGREIWFNQIMSQTPNDRSIGSVRMEVYDRVYGRTLTRPYDTTFGDGEPFDPADVQSLYPILDRLEVDFAWRNGDLMLLDNFYTFHGRSPFTGDRDVQVALIG